MAKFIIQTLSGPLKGKIFDVKNGLSFGREFGDILLKDKAVSGEHAEIQVYSSGKIMIVDIDSKNKIYVNDKQTVKSILEENTKFKIGESEFILKFIKTPEEMCYGFLSACAKTVANTPLALKPFSQAVNIYFCSGIQKGVTYKLYYGPRFFGSRSVDCPLYDKKSPEKSFSLIPQTASVLFKTSYPDRVQFNKKVIKQAELKSGDKIFIGDSILEVKLA